MGCRHHEESTGGGWGKGSGWQMGVGRAGKIKLWKGKRQNHQSILSMAAEKDPPKAGHPEVRGSRKEGREWVIL